MTETNILTELTECISNLGIPVETGIFSDKAPESYVVLTPVSDTYELHADNRPHFETQEVRISLFTKGSYIKLKNTILRAVNGTDIYITDRRYIGYENDTGYHHYAIDVAKPYELEED